MIENHNFSKKSYEILQKTKCSGDKDKEELFEHEIEAVQTYSKDFNRLFPAMSNVEFVYALIGAKKCVETMLNTLFEHEPKFMIHVKLLEAAFDEVAKPKSVMIDESTTAEMMKGTGNDG